MSSRSTRADAPQHAIPRAGQWSLGGCWGAAGALGAGTWAPTASGPWPAFLREQVPRPSPLPARQDFQTAKRGKWQEPRSPGACPLATPLWPPAPEAALRAVHPLRCEGPDACCVGRSSAKKSKGGRSLGFPPREGVAGTGGGRTRSCVALLCPALWEGVRGDRRGRVPANARQHQVSSAQPPRRAAKGRRVRVTDVQVSCH